jgi:hypothetical protein
MAEAKQYVFTHKEVVEALLRKQGIHDGIWGLYIKFGIKAANVGGSPSEIMPSAIIPILEIGLQKFDKESNIAVDAALVNPKEEASRKQKPRVRKI